MLVTPTMFDYYDVLPTLKQLTIAHKLKWHKRYLTIDDPLGDGYTCNHNGIILNLITNTRILHFGRYKFYDAVELLLVVQGYVVETGKDDAINTINTFFHGLCTKIGDNLTSVEPDTTGSQHAHSESGAG